MEISELIPTFDPGERVLLHWREVECKCLDCGTSITGNKERLGTMSIVTVQGKSGDVLWCQLCGAKYDVSGEGWWRVAINPRVPFCVPYTLLEKIPGKGR